MWEFIWRWETLWYAMLILYVPSCIGLIVIVLLQKGKSSGFAGAFGLGAGSDTVFGPRASKSLPQKLTHIMAAIFMILALSMSLIAGRLGKGVAPEAVDAARMEASEINLDVLDDLGMATEVDDTGTAAPLESAPAESEAPVTEAPDVEPSPAEGEVDAEISDESADLTLLDEQGATPESESPVLTESEPAPDAS